LSTFGEQASKQATSNKQQATSSKQQATQKWNPRQYSFNPCFVSPLMMSLALRRKQVWLLMPIPYTKSIFSTEIEMPQDTGLSRIVHAMDTKWLSMIQMHLHVSVKLISLRMKTMSAHFVSVIVVLTSTNILDSQRFQSIATSLAVFFVR
jgi:hypothetical protein